MRPMTSHGRPVAKSEFRSTWISLLLSLSAGALVMSSFLLLAVSELKRQSVDSLVELAKRYSEVIEVSLAHPSTEVTVNKGTLKLKEGLPYEVLLAQTNLPEELSLQERILRVFQNQLSTADLKQKGVQTFTVKRSELGSQELLILARPGKGDDVSFTVLDPSAVSAVLAKAHPHKVALLGALGKVVAHTQASMIGADFSKDSALKSAIGTVMTTGRVVESGTRESGKSDLLEYAILRTSVPGLAVLVERSQMAAAFSISGLAAEKKPFFSMILASILVFSAAVLLVRTRRSEEAIEFPKYPPKDHAKQVLARATEALPGAQTLRIKEQQRAAEAQVAIVQRSAKRDFVLEMQKSATSNSSESEIERKLIQLSSELTESPILFFRYQKTTNNLHLTGHANVAELPNEATFPIYVRPDIESQVLTLANQGKAAALTNYGPVSSLMLQGLNTSHYEAWAVTTGQEMSVNGAELVGLMIVKHAGSRSAEMRPVLARLLKVGANSIYGIRNKISRSNLTRESQSQYPTTF